MRPRPARARQDVPTTDVPGGYQVTIFSGGAPLNIAHGIREFAQAQPGRRRAVIDGDRTFTYAAARRAHQPARQRPARLRAAAPAPPVALLLGNRAEYMEVAAGIARAGFVMVPLNPRMIGARGRVHRRPLRGARR